MSSGKCYAALLPLFLKAPPPRLIPTRRDPYPEPALFRLRLVLRLNARLISAVLEDGQRNDKDF
jgi:hypothetical protein